MQGLLQLVNVDFFQKLLDVLQFLGRVHGQRRAGQGATAKRILRTGEALAEALVDLLKLRLRLGLGLGLQVGRRWRGGGRRGGLVLGTALAGWGGPRLGWTLQGRAWRRGRAVRRLVRDIRRPKDAGKDVVGQGRGSRRRRLDTLRWRGRGGSRPVKDEAGMDLVSFAWGHASRQDGKDGRL